MDDDGMTFKDELAVIDLGSFTTSTGKLTMPTYHELEEVRDSMKNAMGLNGTPAWERGEGGPNDPNANLSDLARNGSGGKGSGGNSGAQPSYKGMVWGVFGTDLNDGKGTNYNKESFAFDLDCRTPAQINADALCGTWVDKEDDFFGGKSIVIKDDDSWAVSGHVTNGKMLYDGDSINGNTDDNSSHSFKFLDDDTVEVTRESDGKTWTLVRGHGNDNDGDGAGPRKTADDKFFEADLFDIGKTIIGGFGHGDSNQGIYAILPLREVSSTMFCRGTFAQGCRGYIDPLDPDNPYGPNSSGDLQTLKDLKMVDSHLTPNAVSGVTAATSHVTRNGDVSNNQTMNLSCISGISNDVTAMEALDADKEFDLDRNPHF